LAIPKGMGASRGGAAFFTDRRAAKEKGMTWDDAYIERWGEVYTAHSSLRRLCTFEQFLVQPAAWLRRLIGEELLPRQRAVQRRLDALRPGSGQAARRQA